ncbi:MAG TPA: DUF167 domain-containing protein [Tepidisphaeraceae bacterium]|jgi:uncharacterized protein (TIGR00251 family)
MSVVLSVKVVPGASRSRVAGRYGEGVKVQVSAAPEKGKANAAVVEVLAAWLGVKGAQVELVGGHVNPRKQFRITGLSAEQLGAKLAEIS